MPDMKTLTRQPAPSRSSLLRTAVGTRRDWAITRPRLRLRPLAALIGPALIAATTLAGWFAFAGAQGEEGGSVALGLFVGAASIVLMAWSFLLAVRIPLLEPIFGGLDRAYQAHRWAGTLAVPTMFLHARLEPEVEGGILGAARSVADTAEGLAGVAEYSIYALVAISLLRWFPYRFWRWTHKLLGIPFVFACWHFFTAEKTYANNSPWGWYFGTIMVVGVIAYLWRVVGRDMIARGKRYEVTVANRAGATLEVELAPKSRPMRHHAGQFAVLKFQTEGLSEPHPFTVASSPDSASLRFYIRDLGDWTHKLQSADLVGTEVLVEGPYGRFEPLPRTARPVVWVAGGVGITPFLSAVDSLPPSPVGQRPTLIYCVPSRENATAIDELEAAHRDGRIELVVKASQDGNRFTASDLETGAIPTADAHVAVCGPANLVADVAAAAERGGAATVESEAFDIRSGIGPDLSREIDELVSTSG